MSAILVAAALLACAEADTAMSTPLDAVQTVGVATFEPCRTSASCAAGASCQAVPGYSHLTCVPPCDPDAPGETCGGGVCLGIGWCAPACDAACDAACVTDERSGRDVCAGEHVGAYEACDTVDDCPHAGACYRLTDDAPRGACLPWCVQHDCPAADLNLTGAPFCMYAGLGELSCTLQCATSADCPDALTCVPLNDDLAICLAEAP